MRTELFIGLRYLFTRRKERFISLITLISVAGIAIGVAALIVVIGVMTGFDRDLHEKIIGNYSHIIITATEPVSEQDYNGLIVRIAPNPHVTGISPYIAGQILVKGAGKFFPVSVKGIRPYTETQVTRLNDYIVAGQFDSLQNSNDEIVVGRELAQVLGLAPGSQVQVYSVPDDRSGGLRLKEFDTVVKEAKLKVSGIFYSKMYDYDLNLTFTSLATAERLFGTTGISGISVKLDNAYIAGKVRDELSQTLGPSFILRTWMEVNPNFFAALKLEKLTMFVILTLIILVASFNIISALIVMVVDKTRDVGILGALGMTAVRVRAIFTCVGLFIGAVGTFLGAAGGLGICWLLKKYQFIKLPQDIYYLDTLPVYIQLWPDVVLIVSAALLITLASTVYPAGKAGKLRPVDALRYE